MTTHLSQASTPSGLTTSGKWKRGRLAALINNRWGNPVHITIKQRICSLDIELCIVGLRLYYLPRELAVYIPPSAACDTIHSAIAWFQTQHSSTFIVISGDFNHVTMDVTL